ncbi:MAG: site-2 protease family protein [Gemmatimonadota bacterium]|nr:site-2 protease family protein [Gemmatimonadota bacterium]
MEYLIFGPVLLMSIVIHEVAHAWQARREGDFTADRLGRITLNPLPHLDPFGSVILPLILIFTQSGVFFGWAKPVPVDPGNYRELKAGDIRVSMAGIVSNLALALIFTLVGTGLALLGPGGVDPILLDVCLLAITVNLMLAFFNLIPIPPLDGSHVVHRLLPDPLAQAYRRMGRFGFLVIIALVFVPPFRGVLFAVLSPVFVLRDAAAFWFMRLWS